MVFDRLIPKTDMEIAKILGDINIFDELTLNERTKISQYFKKETYKPGDIIIKEGDPGDGMFVIKEGAVKVSKEIPGEGEKILANMVDGNFFGEMALFDGAPRSASVIAVSKVEMYEMYRAGLMEFTKKDPKLAVKVLFNLVKILSVRIRQSGDKIKDILIWQTLKKCQ